MDQWYYHYNHIAYQFEFYHFVAEVNEDEFYYDISLIANDINIKDPHCDIKYFGNDFNIMNYTDPLSKAYPDAFESIFRGIFI